MTLWLVPGKDRFHDETYRISSGADLLYRAPGHAVGAPDLDGRVRLIRAIEMSPDAGQFGKAESAMQEFRRRYAALFNRR